MSATDVTEASSGDIDDLLDNLQTVTPAQMASLLQEMGPSLERTEWNTFLYAIEELAETGHADQAQELMTILVQQGRLEQDDWLVRAATHFMGNIHRYRGELGQAVAAYQSVVDSGMAAGDEEGLTQASLALAGISYAHMSRGRTSEALDATRDALALDEQLDRRLAAISDRMALTNLHLAQENFSRAEAIARQVIARAQQVAHPAYVALAWMDLASIQARLYDRKAASESYRNALQVLEGVEDPEDVELWGETYQSVLMDMGAIQQERGQFDEATDSYDEATRVASARGDQRGQIEALISLGSAQLDAGRSEEALRRLRTALQVSDSTGDIWWKGTIHFYQASALNRLGRYDEAKEAVRLAMKADAAISGAHSVHESVYWVQLGNIALEQDQIDSAVKHYQRAVATTREAEVGQADRLVHFWLGKGYWHQGDFFRAYEALRQALSVYETKRRTVRSPMARIEFAPSREDIYAYLVRTCLALKRPVEAFVVVEEGRARVLREQLARKEVGSDLAEALGWEQVRALTRPSMRGEFGSSDARRHI